MELFYFEKPNPKLIGDNLIPEFSIKQLLDKILTSTVQCNVTLILSQGTRILY